MGKEERALNKKSRRKNWKGSEQETLAENRSEEAERWGKQRETAENGETGRIKIAQQKNKTKR